MTSENERASVPERRFRQLLDQIRDELGGGRGWISVAARRMGVHRSTLVKVLKGAPVSATLIDRARVALRLDSRFFTDPTLGDEPGSYFMWAEPDPEVPAVVRDEYSKEALGLLAAARMAGPVARAGLHRRPDLQPLLNEFLRALESEPIFSAYYGVRAAVEAGREPDRKQVFALAWGILELADDMQHGAANRIRKTAEESFESVGENARRGG